MPRTLKQISGIARTPDGQYSPPESFKVPLEPNVRIVQLEWSRGLGSKFRKTVDWTWTVWFEA